MKIGKKNASFSNLLCFVLGVLLSAIVLILLGTYCNYMDPYTIMRGHPKIFGDLKIRTVEENDDKEINCYLVMLKDDKQFFYAQKNKENKVTDVAIVGANNSIRLSIKSSEETGGWKTAIYGCTKGYTKGEQYVDIDFDGQFDAKNIFDNQGELLSKWIYSDGIWQKVDYLDDGKAILGQTRYVFDANSGWRED
jgi:hypothetical protein